MHVHPTRGSKLPVDARACSPLLAQVSNKTHKRLDQLQDFTPCPDFLSKRFISTP
jgi:hypothetical protein